MAAPVIEKSAEISGENPSNPLSRKLSKILESQIDTNNETIEGLKALSGFYNDNSLRSRKNLRGDIEKRSLMINEDFVNNLRQVKEQLDSVHEDVLSMNEYCQDMTNRLHAVKAKTKGLITQSSHLKDESSKLQLRHELASAFLKMSQLTAEENKALRGTWEQPITPQFFTALARVKKIHGDCKVLLRSKQQTAGLEIMESMASQQEAACERLYRWTQSECRSLTTDSPDVNPLLCQGLDNLQDRPVLFRYCLDELSTARRAAVVRGFIDALTRGGPGGTPCPIELHSHDPLRYLGDMLAWLHQASASERELLEALLRNCSKQVSEETIPQVLVHIMEGMCHPLKMRAEQILISGSGATTMYKLTNLLLFYKHTIGQILNVPSAAMLDTLGELHELSYKMFFNNLNCHTNKLLEKVDVPSCDLSPPGAISHTLQLLKEVLASHDVSMTPLEERQQAFTKILNCVLEPILQSCSQSASRLSVVDMATFLVNCIYTVHSTLVLYEISDHRLEMLQAQIDAHLDTLVSEQASHILNQAGLLAVYEVLQAPRSSQPLATLPGMDASTIRTCMGRFETFLSQSEAFIVPQIGFLLSAKLRQNVRQRSTEFVVSVYQQVHSAVWNPNNGYSEPSTLAPRPPDQVAKILTSL